MANHKAHVGIIRPTVPNPEVVWGSIQELADHCNVTRRSISSILNGTTTATKRGFRRMSTEEAIKYYQPPKPPVVNQVFHRKDYASKIHWKITFFKNWKKGEKYPTEKDRKYSGTPQEFSKHLNCNKGLIYRLLNTHDGTPEKYPLRSIQGWTISRVRRYDSKPVRKTRKPKEL
ncbi:hypothetical protein COPG_00092 [Colwellia phage 9A]|uniref:Uncharacterized protein n=1 Tax=Colwellia phage 9A TaxID=765765 RepID=I3UMH3_9CAUD|nr:hypothetical protein COPG_00092 [Colwellia phage 9A]AFK66688.1 hypothetical protein COPG_00092 [Colwellia phage 9A]